MRYGWTRAGTLAMQDCIVAIHETHHAVEVLETF